jgi:lipopolysaccharide/colanic/teichoic acid biosynthesis glycosyltransferase
MSLFYEQWLGRLPIAELERTSLMFDIGEVHRDRYARRTRLLDIVMALAALPLLVAVVPVVVLGNLVANRGPLLFRQARIGKGGRQFSILKFRTMTGGGSGPGRWSEHDDPRVTPWGRFMRRHHIDELPQLVNVLKGDLSMVGPRPEQPHYVQELSSKLPFYDLRHLVKPGITGWAQVNRGYGSSAADALEKLQYEFWYLRHQRITVDIRILVRTVRAITGGKARS